ncbi:MAG: hypothetical protein ACXU8A_09740, partial [Burkholderiaceae bacterium]
YNYSGSAIIASVLPAGQLNTSRYASLSFTYSPIQNFQIGLTAYRDQRTSSAIGADYIANGMFINLRASF